MIVQRSTLNVPTLMHRGPLNRGMSKSNMVIHTSTPFRRKQSNDVGSHTKTSTKNSTKDRGSFEENARVQFLGVVPSWLRSTLEFSGVLVAVPRIVVALALPQAREISGSVTKDLEFPPA